jgi:hypothetical protein
VLVVAALVVAALVVLVLDPVEYTGPDISMLCPQSCNI